MGAHTLLILDVDKLDSIYLLATELIHITLDVILYFLLGPGGTVIVKYNHEYSRLAVEVAYAVETVLEKIGVLSSSGSVAQLILVQSVVQIFQEVRVQNFHTSCFR